MIHSRFYIQARCSEKNIPMFQAVLPFRRTESFRINQLNSSSFWSFLNLFPSVLNASNFSFFEGSHKRFSSSSFGRISGKPYTLLVPISDFMDSTCSCSVNNTLTIWDYIRASFFLNFSLKIFRQRAYKSSMSGS